MVPVRHMEGRVGKFWGWMKWLLFLLVYSMCSDVMHVALLECIACIFLKMIEVIQIVATQLSNRAKGKKTQTFLSQSKGGNWKHPPSVRPSIHALSGISNRILNRNHNIDRNWNIFQNCSALMWRELCSFSMTKTWQTHLIFWKVNVQITKIYSYLL